MRHAGLGLAVVLGLTIGWVDSRPTWDDAGVTALALLLSAGIAGALAPERPWLIALAVGVWVPLVALARDGNGGAALALVFAFAGAYAGSLSRRWAMPRGLPEGS